MRTEIQLSVVVGIDGTLPQQEMRESLRLTVAGGRGGITIEVNNKVITLHHG
jgi:hypothetical protein